MKTSSSNHQYLIEPKVDATYIHSEDSFAYRNMTELVEVVTRAVTYFRSVPPLEGVPQSQTTGTKRVLQDFDDCGMMNNDTFNFCDSNDPDSLYCQGYQSLFNQNWTAQCLWDCTWMDNPVVGKEYKIRDQRTRRETYLKSTMLKVPVDLRCLDDCTTIDFPQFKRWYFDSHDHESQILDCSNSSYDSFLNCYLFNRFQIGISVNYFDLAVESCFLARSKEIDHYKDDCDVLGVNLRIYNPLLPYPHLSNSTSSLNAKLVGASVGIVSFSFLEPPIPNFAPKMDPFKNRYPWVCSLGTSGYNGIHRCGVTLLSGPPQETIFVSAAHCNYHKQ
jgi:hypothetical protein